MTNTGAGMLQRIVQGGGRRGSSACKRPLAVTAAAAAAAAPPATGLTAAAAGAMGRSSSSCARATVAALPSLLRPAQPDAAHPMGMSGGRRGFASARLMTSSSSSSAASSSSSSAGGDWDASSGPATGFWEGPLASSAVHDPTAASSALEGLLPERQVPDAALRFTTVAYVDAGSYIPFPHRDGIDARAFPTNPANFKVTLKVYLKELGLGEREAKRLRCLVGARYNTGRQELTLTTQRFLSRAHNKQYLIYLLENLVAEAKKTAQ